MVRTPPLLHKKPFKNTPYARLAKITISPFLHLFLLAGEEYNRKLFPLAKTIHWWQISSY